jgi:ribose 5-phosphate isomerase B
MKVGIAADHGGFDLKEHLKDKLSGMGFIIVDYGNKNRVSDDDYPDFVIPLALAVAKGEVARGIAVCGSGVGASIAANKVPGIRAALVNDNFTAHQGVEDDDMNILCLGGWVTGIAMATELAATFLKAFFEQKERFVRRLRKVTEAEHLFDSRLNTLKKP